jgi:hypothetical protein
MTSSSSVVQKEKKYYKHRQFALEIACDGQVSRLRRLGRTENELKAKIIDRTTKCTYVRGDNKPLHVRLYRPKEVEACCTFKSNMNDAVPGQGEMKKFYVISMSTTSRVGVRITLYMYFSLDRNDDTKMLLKALKFDIDATQSTSSPILGPVQDLASDTEDESWADSDEDERLSESSQRVLASLIGQFAGIPLGVEQRMDQTVQALEKQHAKQRDAKWKEPSDEEFKALQEKILKPKAASSQPSSGPSSCAPSRTSSGASTQSSAASTSSQSSAASTSSQSSASSASVQLSASSSSTQSSASSAQSSSTLASKSSPLSSPESGRLAPTKPCNVLLPRHKLLTSGIGQSSPKNHPKKVPATEMVPTLCPTHALLANQEQANVDQSEPDPDLASLDEATFFTQLPQIMSTLKRKRDKDDEHKARAYAMMEMEERHKREELAQSQRNLTLCLLQQEAAKAKMQQQNDKYHEQVKLCEDMWAKIQEMQRTMHSTFCVSLSTPKDAKASGEAKEK